MKTAYKILWIDDDRKTVDVDQEEVGDFLDQFGIRADITFVEAPADGTIRDRLEHDLKDPDLDILLVDYMMDGLRGDQLVHLIRESDHIYLPVIFYSSSSVDELFRAVSASKLDGVYVANRTALMNKFESVVKSLLVREQTVKQVRGLLMEGVSEIDAQFFEIFQSVWVGLDPDSKGHVIAYLQRILDDRAKSATSKAGELPKSVAGFEAHIKDGFLTGAYDTSTRWRLTMKLLKLAGHPEEHIAELKKFADAASAKPERPLNMLRNDYAHQTRKALEAGHSDDRCVEIRRAITSQSANIDSILGTE
jgi:CheY-like chemotaxis protein